MLLGSTPEEGRRNKIEQGEKLSCSAVPEKALATLWDSLSWAFLRVRRLGLYTSGLDFQSLDAAASGRGWSWPSWLSLHEAIPRGNWELGAVNSGHPQKVGKKSFIPEGAPATEGFSVCHFARNRSPQMSPSPTPSPNKSLTPMISLCLKPHYFFERIEFSKLY